MRSPEPAVAMNAGGALRGIGGGVGLRTPLDDVPVGMRDGDRGRAGVQVAIDGMKFDRWIVDVDDAVDAARHRLADVVDLRLAHAARFEKGRAGLVERDDDTAREDR